MRWDLTKVEFARTMHLWFRYPSELLSQFLLVIGVFLGLLWSANTVAGHVPTLGTERLIAEYIGWVVALGNIGIMGWSITAEIQTGTFEQLVLAPLPLWQILSLRSIVGIVPTALFTAISTILLTFIASVPLHNWGLLAVPWALTYVTSLGLGFSLVAIAMIAKRIHQLISLLQYALLLLMLRPLTVGAGVGPWSLVPFWSTIRLLGTMLSTSTPRLPPSSPALLIATASSIFWVAFGVLLFRLALTRATHLGSLSHY